MKIKKKNYRLTYDQQISLPKTVTSKQRKWIHITVTLSKYKHTKTYRQILERDEMSLWLVPKKKGKETSLWSAYQLFLFLQEKH